MAKKTLLEMTQQILSAMDSDNVNSIDDSIEAMQVAEVIREAYEDLVTQRDWPFLDGKTALTGLGDVNNPTKMQIPATVNKIHWVKYNGEDVSYLAPKEFQDLIDGRTEQAGVVDANGFIINRDPLYWTTFDDEYVFFDSYDEDTEASLQTANSVIYAQTIPTWTIDDDFTPTLPEKMFPTLIADAKSTAFIQIKQQPNPKEETKARRGKARFQNEAKRTAAAEHVTNGGVNYGRK